MGPTPEGNRPGHRPEQDQDRPSTPGPWLALPADRLRFRFEPATAVLGAPFGITPWTTWLDLTGGEISIRYGIWSLTTPMDNVAGTERTGPYDLVKIAGPPHLSFADRGVSFATTRAQGTCIRFHEPVKALDPLGVLRHPAATVTVEDLDALEDTLGRATGSG